MIVKNLLLKHEGLRLMPYRCTSGKLTIGCGRNLEDSGISKAEAMMMLENDIERATYYARSSFEWFSGLNEVRQAVIISLIFNLGINGFSKFTKTINLIRSGDFYEAGIELLKSRWSEQVGERARELALMLQTGKQ